METLTKNKPLAIGIAVVAVVAAAFMAFRSLSSTATIHVPPKKLPGYSSEMPAYVKEGRTPRPDEAPGAPPTGQPPATAPR